MRALAERAHHHPDGSVIRVSRTVPAASTGCGRECAPTAGWVRRHPELFEEAAALRRDLPARSAAHIADILSTRHGIRVAPVALDRSSRCRITLPTVHCQSTSRADWSYASGRLSQLPIVRSQLLDADGSVHRHRLIISGGYCGIGEPAASDHRPEDEDAAQASSARSFRPAAMRDSLLVPDGLDRTAAGRLQGEERPEASAGMPPLEGGKVHVKFHPRDLARNHWVDRRNIAIQV
jgi:hypothetical protein